MFFSHSREKKHETKQQQMGQRKGEMAVNAKKEKTINVLVFVKEKNKKGKKIRLTKNAALGGGGATVA